MFLCVPHGPTQYIFHTPMTRCSLFVLKVSLNTNKPNQQKRAQARKFNNLWIVHSLCQLGVKWCIKWREHVEGCIKLDQDSMRFNNFFLAPSCMVIGYYRNFIIIRILLFLFSCACKITRKALSRAPLCSSAQQSPSITCKQMPGKTASGTRYDSDLA